MSVEPFPASAPSGDAAGTPKADEQLRAIVARIERLEEEKKAIMADIKEVYDEAKGNGFDVKVLRQVIRIRKQDRQERQEMEAILETYLGALGDL
jgi:uncharacterized protein (UPF0335 family)